MGSLNGDILLHIREHLTTAETAVLCTLSRWTYDILRQPLYSRITVCTPRALATLSATLCSRLETGAQVHALYITFDDWAARRNIQLGEELLSILQRTPRLRELAAPSYLLEHLLALPQGSTLRLPGVHKLAVGVTFPPCRALAEVTPNVECLALTGISGGGGFGVPFVLASVDTALDVLWPRLAAVVVDDMTPPGMLSPGNGVSHLEVAFNPPTRWPVYHWTATRPEIAPSRTLTHLLIRSAHHPGHFDAAFFEALPALRVFETGLRVAANEGNPGMAEGHRNFWLTLGAAPVSTVRCLCVAYVFVDKRPVTEGTMRNFVGDRVAEMPTFPVTLDLLSVIAYEMDAHWQEPLRWHWRRSRGPAPSSSIPGMEAGDNPVELEQHALREAYRWPSRYLTAEMGQT